MQPKPDKQNSFHAVSHLKIPSVTFELERPRHASSFDEPQNVIIVLLLQKTPTILKEIIY